MDLTQPRFDRNHLQLIMPMINFIFVATLPSALVLYYATSGVIQVFTEFSLRRLGS